MNKAYKFRLYPNKEQEVYFSKCFGCVRFIYNQMLADKIKHYEETKEKLNNTPAQYKKEFDWLKEIDSLALANAQMNLQSAYNNFFRDKKVGFPKFKSKHKSKKSYTTNNQKDNIRIEQGKIKLPKIGWIKIKLHRQIPNTYQIKSCTISQTPTGKYYISILTEYECEIKSVEINPNNVIGLDMDMKNLFTDSQGNRAEYSRYFRQMQDKLAKEQRKLSLMKYSSNNYYKQKLRVAKLHEHISNQRKDWIHKLSTQLANEYDYICVEDINMQNMAQSL
jgi:putative transposase